MHVLHIVRALLHCLLTRQVVEYNAQDPEHGPVRVEVRANRLTG